VTDRDLSGAEVARRFFTYAVEPLLSQADRTAEAGDELGSRLLSAQLT
jgi:hypothetical protein